MTPSNTLIMKAPGCANSVKFDTIASGNTFGATFWTDGKREAPMLPDDPWLKISPSEGVMFWADECEEIGREDFSGSSAEHPEWADLDYAVEPGEANYISALKMPLANTQEKETYIRMRLWWVGNDKIRRGEASELSSDHIENLRCLETLLSEDDDNQKVMKVEVLRELGKFDAALRLLDGSFPSGYERAVCRIRELAASSDCKVAKLADS